MAKSAKPSVRSDKASGTARIALCALASVVLNAVLGVGAARVFPSQAAARGLRTASVRIERFVVPTPRPLPTPPPRWDRLDHSSVRSMRRLPDRLRIVVLAPRRTDGAASDAPAVLRVDISPPDIRGGETLHIRVLTSPDADGVYVRFAVWEIGVPPLGGGTFPASDPDYPDRRYEAFARDYAMPPIPGMFANRTYNVEVVAVGRSRLASATYVPLTLSGTPPRS